MMRLVSSHRGSAATPCIANQRASSASLAAGRQQPVAWLARDMGGNRRNVQRIINDLHREELVAFESNPHHRRAQLVVLTAKGRQIFDAAMRLQAPWINSLAKGISVKEVETVRQVLATLRANILELRSEL